jgi:hypothetical protein
MTIRTQVTAGPDRAGVEISPAAFSASLARLI